MDSGYWQSQFEDWLRHHHQEQDAAHDIFHFRRVWATAQTLGENSPVDWLVVLSACYFHDIVSLAKNSSAAASFFHSGGGRNPAYFSAGFS